MEILDSFTGAPQERTRLLARRRRTRIFLTLLLPGTPQAHAEILDPFTGAPQARTKILDSFTDAPQRAEILDPFAGAPQAHTEALDPVPRQIRYDPKAGRARRSPQKKPFEGVCYAPGQYSLRAPDRVYAALAQ